MKLSKSQIEAVTEEVMASQQKKAVERKENFLKKNDEKIKNRAEEIETARKLIKEILLDLKCAGMELSIPYVYNGGKAVTTSEDLARNEFIKNKFKEEKKETYTEIYRRVTLLTIEAKDLQQLKKLLNI